MDGRMDQSIHWSFHPFNPWSDRSIDRLIDRLIAHLAVSILFLCTAAPTRQFQQRSGKNPVRCHIMTHISYHHIIIWSYHHIIISFYHHIIVLSYHHIITSSDRQPKKNEKPLLSKLSRSSRDLCESLTDSHKSWDDRLNSPKSGVWIFVLWTAQKSQG